MYHQLKFHELKNITCFFIVACFFFPNTSIAQKINGISIGGPKKTAYTLEMFDNIKVSSANWVALIPEATLDRTTLLLKSDAENNWWAKTITANIAGIQLAKQTGFKVFLKPHIVLGEIPEKKNHKVITVSRTNRKQRLKDKTGGVEWRGELAPKKESDWLIWEANYEAYILQLAKVAEVLEVDLFSIGTELKQSAWRRPAFWRQLIQKVRIIYAGELVYSANWDEYQKITFWQDLDYIGVDTYFPINKMETPSIKKTLKNWRSIQKQLKKISKKENRKILLTEFGYRSVAYAGKRPWTHNLGGETANNEAQRNLYEAFFQTFWKKNWIAGGFAWKWYCIPPYKEATSFAIQNKSALTVLQRWYTEYEDSLTIE